jgi:hypothetical protein
MYVYLRFIFEIMDKNGSRAIDDEKSREARGHFGHSGWCSCLLNVPVIYIHDVYTFLISSLIFKNQEDKPVGGMNGQTSLGFCDIMNQKQNKQTEG